MPQMNNLGNAPQLNDVISKYGEGYNGPIDLLGGGEKLTSKNEGAKQKQKGGDEDDSSYIGEKNSPFNSKNEDIERKPQSSTEPMSLENTLLKLCCYQQSKFS